MLSRRRRFPLRQRSLKRPPEPTGKTPAGGKPSMSELPKVSRRLLNTRSMAIQRPEVTKEMAKDEAKRNHSPTATPSVKHARHGGVCPYLAKVRPRDGIAALQGKSWCGLLLCARIPRA